MGGAQMKNKSELYYILSRQALKKLLELGHLSKQEFDLAESYLAEKYRPILRPV